MGLEYTEKLVLKKLLCKYKYYDLHIFLIERQPVSKAKGKLALLVCFFISSLISFCNLHFYFIHLLFQFQSNIHLHCYLRKNMDYFKN